MFRENAPVKSLAALRLQNRLLLLWNARWHPKHSRAIPAETPSLGAISIFQHKSSNETSWRCFGRQRRYRSSVMSFLFGQTQFSDLIPGMRLNSRKLLVTTISPSLRA